MADENDEVIEGEVIEGEKDGTEVVVTVTENESAEPTGENIGTEVALVAAAAMAGAADAKAEQANETAESAEQQAQENAQQIEQVKEEQETWQATTQKILSELAQGQQVLMAGLTALAETVREMVTKMSPPASPQIPSEEGADQERTAETVPAPASESVVDQVAAAAAEKVEVWI